jgi:hypothetical protein
LENPRRSEDQWGLSRFGGGATCSSGNKSEKASTS